jgi:hypothetical protein
MLGSAGARLEACVCKIYDRSIAPSHNLRLCHIKKQGDCDIYCLYIRGKQLAAGADPTIAEAVAHGGTGSDHASEAAIAELIFREVVAEKIEKRKAEYSVAMKRIHDKGFGAKLASPEFQALVTAEMEAMRRAADARPFMSDSHTGIVVAADSDVESCGDEAPPRTPLASSQRSCRTPGSAAAAIISSSSEYEDSDSDASIDCDGLLAFTASPTRLVRFEGDTLESALPAGQHKSNSGMGTSSSCAHLPPYLEVQQHVHTIHKMEADGEYVCGVCGGRGAGGMVYGCVEAECAGWCSHLRCVLVNPKEHDLRSVLPASAVTSTFMALQHDSDMFDLRAVLIMDGCNGQVRAAKDLLEKIFWPKGIDILKGSAQCSPSQNPLDCMRSFMQVKKSKPTWTWQSATCASTEMLQFIEKDFRKTMLNCSQTDVNSFVLSLRHLEQSLSSCFTVKTMQSGWAKAGLIGLELHQIMSHWIGWKHLSAEQVQGACVALCMHICVTFASGIRNLLPAFFHEMAATGILSDSSMQAMQPFFDVDFMHYVVDRSTLTTSRTRAQIISVFERNLRQSTLDALCRELALGGDEEKRPEHPILDKNGLCICECKGRHYKNDDSSWAKHITYVKHRFVFVLLFASFVTRKQDLAKLAAEYGL